MSGAATLSTEADAGLVANVTFRVRCETIGYGEEVFLVPEEPHGVEKVSHSLPGLLLLIAGNVGWAVSPKCAGRSEGRETDMCGRMGF